MNFSTLILSVFTGAILVGSSHNTSIEANPSQAVVYNAIYNVYFHPLSRVPGPVVWTAFRLKHILSLWQGRLVYDVFDLHQRYFFSLITIVSSS